MVVAMARRAVNVELLLVLALNGPGALVPICNGEREGNEL